MSLRRVKDAACASDRSQVLSAHAQAALPYKSKPKVSGPRKRQTLEQKRAVVLEPSERKAVSLVHQLNALRNEKAIKRREKQARQRTASLSAPHACCHSPAKSKPDARMVIRRD